MRTWYIVRTESATVSVHYGSSTGLLQQHCTRYTTAVVLVLVGFSYSFRRAQELAERLSLSHVSMAMGDGAAAVLFLPLRASAFRHNI